VSTITSTRLFFELAEAFKKSMTIDISDSEGESDGDMEVEDEEGSDFEMDIDDEGEEDKTADAVSLVKLAKDLREAAQATRVKYQHPTIRIVLPNIYKGASSEIDELLAELEATGATVDCASTLPDEKPLSKSLLAAMTPNPFGSFTPTLNIDCTILLALVSDLSHYTVAPAPHHHRALVRQIEIEKEDRLLPSLLFPALGDHALLCSHEAAVRMREIVATIGTETEKARTALLMGDDNSLSHEEVIARFQPLSEFAIPVIWNLPIAVVSFEETKMLSTLPAVAKEISAELSTINRSVFMYGWAMGLTTLSSNRTVAKRIELVFERRAEVNEEKGPDIWVCPTARSLAGKERLRKP
jgi:Protein of unknown function (DUF1308)